MANVDYVVVGPGPLLADVTNAVKLASGATDLVNGNVLITGDDRTSLTVYSDEPEIFVDVYYGADLDQQRAISQRIYDHIVEHTDWDVRLESDETDDIIASRTASD
ncbi:hypothetical protein [Mycobacterium marinum]|uniref:hypothetical protein n=1 Tax=Mycobacterium marinum TaxID=1781 RepID=UPI0021C31509|nr:hypothetical protein [Mycobacterium marinum]